MLNEILSNIIRFIGVILIQGLFINEIDLGAYFVPYIYILFIMRLPFETPRWMVLFLAFGTGVVMDSFTNTPGLHISSCVFLAFIRPSILKIYQPRDGYEFGLKPNIRSMGITWFVYYATWMTVSFHAWFFILEAFSFSGLIYTLFRIICSSLLALLLIMLSQFIILGNESRK